MEKGNIGNVEYEVLTFIFFMYDELRQLSL